MCLCVFTTGIVFFLASLTTVHCSCHCQLVTILMVGKLFAVIFRLIIILLFQMCCCCLNAATDLACQRSSTKDTLCQCLQLCFCCWSSHCVLSLCVFLQLPNDSRHTKESSGELSKTQNVNGTL